MSFPAYIVSLNYKDRVVLINLLNHAILQIPFDLDKLNDKERLYKYGFIPLVSDEKEGEFLKYWARNICYGHHLFSSYILLTYKCNMECKYCYEQSVKNLSFSMDRSIAEDIARWMAREIEFHDSSLADIAFFGGEPLLNQEILFYMASILTKYTEKKGIKRNFALITNGTLLSRVVFQELIKYGIGTIQVTMDGPKIVHDELRPMKSGDSSYDMILSNLENCADLIDKKVNFIVNVNLGSANTSASTITMLLKDLEKLNLKSKITIAFSNIFSPFKETNICYFSHINKEADYLGKQVEIIRKVKEMQFYVDYRYFLRIGACTFKRKNYFVVDPVGEIYKCPAGVGNEKFRIGNVKENIWNIEKKESIFINNEVWNNENCLSCKYLPLCFGGCQFQSFLHNSKFDKYCKPLFHETKLKIMEELLRKRNEI